MKRCYQCQFCGALSMDESPIVHKVACPGRTPPPAPAEEEKLSKELAAWDAASDADLSKFENGSGTGYLSGAIAKSPAPAEEEAVALLRWLHDDQDTCLHDGCTVGDCKVVAFLAKQGGPTPTPTTSEWNAAIEAAQGEIGKLRRQA